MAQTDRKALVAFYRATDGANWNNSTGWDTAVDLSDWYGIKTNDQGRVVKLGLYDNNLRGINCLPYEVFVVHSCGVFDLSQEFGDRKWSFHEIARFAGSHNVVFLVRTPRVLRLSTPCTSNRRSTSKLCARRCCTRRS